MGHLNSIQEDFDGKGLTILSVTGEDRERVDPFVEELGAEFPILCKAQSADYSTGGVPSAYLIGADGTVVWQGHPASLGDSDIEKHLKDVAKENRVSTWAFTVKQNLPTPPESMAGIPKMLEKMKFGAALKKAEGALAKLEGEDKEAGEKVRAWIADRGTSSMEKAGELVDGGQVYAGYLVYERVSDEFKGHDLGKQAKNELKALKSGKETKLEIKASEKLADLKKEMAKERKAEDKLKCLKPLLSKKYADTLAGKTAAEMAEELEAKVEK